MKLATTTEDFNKYCDTYLERVKCVHEAGFKYIDLSLYTVKENDELLISDGWEATAKELLDYAKANGMEFVQCHSPNTNPIDEAQTEKAVALNIRAIEVCGFFKIPAMVVHSGWDKNATKEEWFARNKAFFDRILPTAEKYHVCICHENSTSVNIGGVYPKTGAEMREFSEYVGHPLFHSCWDTGHANIEGSQYEELLTIGDDLKAVHINDNRGERDEHVIPYFGTVNMDEIMTALKEIDFKGPFTFESGSTLRPNKYWLGNRKQFDKSTRLAKPTVEMQFELEKFMYLVGKHILSAYDEFEG